MRAEAPRPGRKGEASKGDHAPTSVPDDAQRAHDLEARALADSLDTMNWEEFCKAPRQKPRPGGGGILVDGWINPDPSAMVTRAGLQRLFDVPVLPKHAPARQAPTTAQAVDPGEAQGWYSRGVEEMLSDLRAAHDWPEGYRDDKGRGWEKLCADIALKLQRYAAAASLDEAELRERFVAAAPRGGDLNERWLRNKWRSQTTKADKLGPWPLPDNFGSVGSIFQPRQAEVPATVAGAASPAAEPATEEDARIIPTLDWAALWADESEEEWIVEPILPARRLVALYSPPKVGKSLLMLELAASVAAGRTVLGIRHVTPRSVLYVDFENDPKSDIRPRLTAMGYGPADLTRLHYLSFPAIAYLDSPTGADQLLANVHHHAAEVVVIDTVSRAVAGEENENDTWLAFYRHTGLALKQAQVACIRLDHTGKDESKGQRGASAKSGDVDAVWRLSEVVKGETYRLTCEAHRMPIHEPVVTINRRTDPLRHEVKPGGNIAAWEAKVTAAVNALNEAGVSKELGRDRARDALEAHHGGEFRVSNEVLSKALQIRRRQINGSQPQINGPGPVQTCPGQVPSSDLSGEAPDSSRTGDE